MEARVTTFEGWLHQNRAHLHHAVKIVYSETHGTHLRIKDDCMLSAGEEAFVLPHDLSFSVQDMQWANPPWPRDFVERWKAAPEVLTRFLLIEQYLLAEASFWWPYLQLLPRPNEPALLNTPMWWSDEDIDWIRGTNLESARDTRMSLWQQEHQESIDLLHSSFVGRPFHAEAMTWILYKWAATIITSRCFPSNSLKDREFYRGKSVIEAGLENKSQLFPQIVEPFPVLLPIFDLANHDPDAKVTWLWGSQKGVFKCELDVIGGGQVMNNYGPKGNEELIIGYGFSIPNNVSESIALAITVRHVQYDVHESADRSSNIAVIDSGIFTRASYQADQQKATENVARTTSKSRAFRLQRPHGHPLLSLDASLVSAIALMVATARETQNINERLESQGIPWNTSDPLTRHQLATSSQLIQTLQDRQEQLRRLAARNGKPTNRHQYDACNYLTSQLDVLCSILAPLESFLDSNTTKVNYILRMDDMLSRSPKSFGAQFRAAIHLAFRTRNTERLRRMGCQEAVMTIWLCTSWLCYAEDSVGVAIEGGFSPMSQLTQWFQFLRQTYGPPHEPHAMLPNEAACDLVDDGNRSANEDSKVAQSILAVIHAAAEKYPQSLYSSQVWTSSFIRWALEILHEESFILPRSRSSVIDENCIEPERCFLLALATK